MSNQPTRSHTTEIEIDAPAETVWDALTNPTALTCWYVEEATFEPKVGGKYWISWGHGQEGGGTVEAFEPRAHLRLALDPMDAKGESCVGPIQTQPEAPITEDYTLTSRGDRTVLTLVTAGVPASDDWDMFFEGTKEGWAQFFRQLRHYAEHHAGTPRRALTLMRPVPADAWARILGRDGLCAEGSLSDATAGSRYQVTTAFGDTLSGAVVHVVDGSTIELTVDDYDQAYLAVSLGGGGAFLWLSLSTFGLDDERTRALHQRWNTWAEELLATSSA